MRYLTDQQIAACAAEQLAAEVADKAEDLQRRARDAGLVLEVTSVADLFSVVTVRARNQHAPAQQCVVPA